MPAISLVVCVHQQRELLQRLLKMSAGCYDDLVVVHDIPDTTGVRGVVEAAGGRFFERPPLTLQEPHWPFAWEQAAHDWILRLDADEFPSDEMKAWLQEFRARLEPADSVSGYTCFWPIWNGDRQVSRRWPAGRNFLFNRRRVRFFGMPEQTPVPDGKFEPLDLVLHHRPSEKRYNLWNFLTRRQARRGRAFVAHSLLGKPTDLPCWRWEGEAWPEQWERIRRHPVRAALHDLSRGCLAMLRSQWRLEKRFFPTQAIGGGLFHCLLDIQHWRLRRRQAGATTSNADAPVGPRHHSPTWL